MFAEDEVSDDEYCEDCDSLIEECTCGEDIDDDEEISDIDN
jgi:hypothetical protein